MAIAGAGHKISVAVTFGDGTDGRPTKYIDTFQSIEKPISSIKFGLYPPDDAVKLGYVSADDISADKNIKIVDRSYSILENSRDFTSEEETFDGKVFNSYYKSILATDVWTTGSPSAPSIPLYFYHRLSSDINTSRVKILDKNFNPISASKYKVSAVYKYNETTGTVTSTVDYIAVYNSLENSYDEDTAALTLYYVRYIDASGEIQTELLNNTNVFRPATVSDVWTNAKLKPWLKIYKTEQIGSYYKFTFASSAEFSIKILDRARIYTEYPVANSKNYPWFLRFADGDFITQTATGSQYIYDIPEFHTQTFNPIEPYKIAAEEKVTKLTSNIVLFKHAPLAFSYLPADLIIKDKDNSILYALTTDSTKHDTVYKFDTSKSWDSTKIISWDAKTGIVQLDIDVKDYYEMTATYYYEEEWYELTTLDLNPISNVKAASDGFFAVYIVPRSSFNYGVNATETIYYVHVDRSGKITETSESFLNDTVANGGIIGMDYGSYESTSTGTFLGDYTTYGPAGSDGETKRYFVVAEVSVSELSGADSVAILDVRENGGGIKEEKTEEAIKKVPEAQFISDWFPLNGYQYPGEASVVVKIPYTTLKDYGGVLTEQQVKDYVARHKALGVYPLVRFYGVIPKVFLAAESFLIDNAVKIFWKAETSDYTFNVYYGIQKDGRFTKANSVAISNNSNGNEYLLTGLKPNAVYWTYVTAVDSNGIESPRSKMLKVVPFNSGTTSNFQGNEFTVSV